MSASVIANLSGPNPTVKVNDVELPAAEVYISQKRDNFPQVVVVLDAGAADVSIDNADVQIQGPQGNIVEFLRKVDPAALEELVLANSSYADSIVSGVLKALQDMAAQ